MPIKDPPYTFDDPAFPQLHHGLPLKEIGLTKREYFAMHALQGISSSITIGRAEYMPLIAKTAVQYADALIAELEKPEGQERSDDD